jgi:hypothetical protein
MGYLMALALFPITAAITLYLTTQDKLAVFPGLAAGVIYVAGLGLILVITALRGRKLGFLGFVSVVAMIPVGLSIGFATDIRENYANGSEWRGWIHDEFAPSLDAEPTPIYTGERAFDPASAFTDYETVAINGPCYHVAGEPMPPVSGTVSLTAVATDQTITVTSTDTLLSIPAGTSLAIVNDGGMDGLAMSTVTWGDRDVSCELTSVDSPAVQLGIADAPVLTVVLDDTTTDGFMNLWIEEN